MKRPAIAVVSLIALSPIVLYTGSPPGPDPAEPCRALADLHIEDTNLLSATVVPASVDLPEYCRVLGYVRPAIQFEIRLPTSGWNGKFYMGGCGGACGKLESDNPASQFLHSINYGLKRSYAVSTTDGGHRGESVWDSRWAHNSRSAEIDYGYRAVRETARVTKTIIDAFYGKPPARSYFGGCSNGGRQGVMEALRYPEDFDGIIADAPALDFLRAMLAAGWAARANTGPDGKNLIGPDEVKLIEEAVYNACDRSDGLEDGLISDPRACQFDPSVLECARESSAGCLSADQVQALKAIYQGPRDAAGRQLYPGVPIGSEPFWEFWITGETSDISDDLFRILPEGVFRYMAFAIDPGEHFTLEHLDFERDPTRLEFMARIYDATDPDLEPFRRRGGKLLIVQGWGDPAGYPMKTIEYYEAIENRVGSRKATQDFIRVFMVPGMDHCGIGDGPGVRDAGFDHLTALEQWVEEGEPPTSLLTTKTDSAGRVLWTRPVCPYPQRAVYRGRGDVKDGANFRCVTPD